MKAVIPGLMTHPINLGSRLEQQGLAGCQQWACGLAPPNNCKARRITKLLSSTHQQPVFVDNKLFSAPHPRAPDCKSIIAAESRWTRSRVSRRASRRVPRIPHSAPDQSRECSKTMADTGLQLAGWADHPLCFAHLSVYQGATGPGRGQGSRHSGLPALITEVG
jgi:hypothetical protein